MLRKLYRLMLHRKPFKGQFRLFSWLFYQQKLNGIKAAVKPLDGDFLIHVDTKNYIDAWIYYAGDYEPFVKTHFKKYVQPGATILDVGANIGFHTLYLAGLTGKQGKVIAIEPMPVNFKALTVNIQLNSLPQVTAINKAFGNENEMLNIHVDPAQKNPGAYNLFEEGEKNTLIECVKGDDLLTALNIGKIDLIKIDVEGYEFEALKGLKTTIKNDKPVIIFEYDRDYQLKKQEDAGSIFSFLAALGYHFLSIDNEGNTTPFHFNSEINGAQILGLPI